MVTSTGMVLAGRRFRAVRWRHTGVREGYRISHGCTLAGSKTPLRTAPRHPRDETR